MISRIAFALFLLVPMSLSPVHTRGDDSALRPAVYSELPLGAIKPTGWLKNQLRIQADGLGGHLDEFWPDIKDSAWIGGKAEGWERTPYWLDGFIPLAFLLDDPALKAKAKKYVDYILDHQTADGWLGPVGDNDPKHKPYDVWPLFVMFKALRQYQEATGDTRIIPALVKCSKKIDEVITKEPLYSWAHFRAADLALTLEWLHEKTGDKSLLTLADKVLKQGFDWRKHFENFENYREKTTKFGLENHGVNNGMALKFGGVRYRLNGDEKDKDSIFNMIDKLDQYHGQATGIFTCDEHYAGRNPSQGTELCTVAEAMYSLELMEGITGDARLGDRLEKLAFNAFPATFSKDMRGHQYDQQANQVVCKLSDPRVYTDNGPDSNLYGLEPNFGCCTANMHQGWPKFVTQLWAKRADGGLAAMAYAPCIVNTEIGGKKVQIEVKGDYGYPFGGSAGSRVILEVRSKERVRFSLLLRIPEWSVGAKCSVNLMETKSEPGRFCVLDREWGGAEPDEVSLALPMPVKLRKGFNDSISIERGPLVFSLKLGTAWKKLRGKEPFADYEVYPTTPWNYALEIDQGHPENSITFERTRVGDAANPIGTRPFSQDGAPLIAKVKGRRLPTWTLEKNAAAPPPKSPVTSDEPLEDLVLIPYGCTDLRVTEFPTLKP